MTAAVAVLYLALSFGLPLPQLRIANRKDQSRPYPCLSRACGCLTYEQCWAGDCCCMTMSEKLAWARANAVEPPESALCKSASESDECEWCGQTDATKQSCCGTGKTTRNKSDSCCQPVRSAKPGRSCCKESAPNSGNEPIRWLVAADVFKCHGQSSAGLLPVLIATEPPLPFTFVAEVVSVDCLSLIDVSPFAISFVPDPPPPRF